MVHRAQCWPDSAASKALPTLHSALVAKLVGMLSSRRQQAGQNKQTLRGPHCSDWPEEEVWASLMICCSDKLLRRSERSCRASLAASFEKVAVLLASALCVRFGSSGSLCAAFSVERSASAT